MKDLKNIKVLIAEDDYLVAEEIVRVLLIKGFKVIGTVSNGEQAIKMTQKLKPDVVLMDVQMPKMDGLQATKEIQKVCPTPVVILTAFETNDLVEQASKAGASAYLVKPPKAAEIERYIIIAIARHKELLKSNNLNIELQKEINERKKVEAALRKSEENYHKLFEDSPVALLKNDMSELFLYFAELKEKGIHDFRKYFTEHPEKLQVCTTKIKILNINKQYLKLHKAKSKKKFMSNIFSVFTDVSRNVFKESMSTLASGEVGFESETEIKTLTKEVRKVYLKLKINKIKGKDIDSTHGSIALFDITARKKAEAKLKFLSDITKQSSTSIIATDLDFKITWVNDAFEDSHGYSFEEVVGRTPGFLNVEPLSDNIQKEIYETVSKGKTYQSVVLNRKTDGTIFHCGIKVFPIFDTEGKIISYSSLQSDITERIKIETALLESENKFRNLTSTAHDAIVMVNNKGQISYWNEAAEKMFQYLSDETIGESVHELIIPNPLIDEAKNGFEVFKGTGSGALIGKTNEMIGKRKDGTEFPIEISLSKLKLDGEWNATAIVRDITQRKKAEEDLKISLERFAILNKIIRHDLSNDFMVIQSAINLYKRSSEETMIAEMENRVVRSLKTIDNYRKYEQFINSNVDLLEIKVNEYIHECIKGYSNINFTVKGKCLIFADEAISPVFTNLITNSIKHGKAKNINIEVTSKNDMCEIRFIDDGVGIPDKIKFKIFQEGFYYGKTGHTGIGLHIVKKTIDRYGGYIYAENNKPKGAVFVIGLKKVIAHKSDG